MRSLIKALSGLVGLVTAVLALWDRTHPSDPRPPIPSPPPLLRPATEDLAAPAEVPEVKVTFETQQEDTSADDNQGVELSLQKVRAVGAQPDRLNDLNQTIERMLTAERVDFEQRHRRAAAAGQLDLSKGPSKLTVEIREEYSAHELASLLFTVIQESPSLNIHGVHKLRFLNYDIREGQVLAAEQLLQGKQRAFERLIDRYCQARPHVNGCHAVADGLLLTADGVRLYYGDSNDTNPHQDENFTMAPQRELSPRLRARLAGR